MDVEPDSPSLPPPIYRGPFPQLLTLWCGPVVCWLSAKVGKAIFWALIHQWPTRWPAWPLDYLEIGATVLHFPCSALVCGGFSSFFLNGRCHPETPIRDVDWVTRYLFFLPFFVYSNFWCALVVVVPIHNWCFNVAFYFALTYWQSGNWRRWLGEFE